MSLQIEHRETAEGIVIVTIAGRLMLGTPSEQLETEVSELLAEGRRKFIFDLTGMTRIDSTGIGRFIYCYNKISEHAGELALAGAAGYVRDGFRVSRLDTVFRFYPDVDAALQKLA
jgi:anti-sigma B factor antagonist